MCVCVCVCVCVCAHGPNSVKVSVYVNVVLSEKVAQHLSVPTEQVHRMTGQPHLSVCTSLRPLRWPVTSKGQIMGFFLLGRSASLQR